MDDAEVFARCAERRREIADLLDTLDDARLAAPSLCRGWDVKTVAAHLTTGLVVSKPRFGLTVLRNRGSYDRASDETARELAEQPAAVIAETLREHAESRFTPPLHGPSAPLTDLVVHTGDIRVPLGLALEVQPAEAGTVFDFLAGFHMFFIPRDRLRGIRIAPRDLDRTWGSGAELTGRAADVIMAVFGRPGFLETVGGPGRELLAHRV